MTALAMNKVKGNIKVNIIDAPVHGINRKEILDDLAALTNATIINENLGDDIDLISIDALGRCKKAISNRIETILQVEEISEEVETLITNLRGQIESTSNTNLKLRYEKRLSRLTGKVAIVKVGANSEVELKKRKIEWKTLFVLQKPRLKKV